MTVIAGHTDISADGAVTTGPGALVGVVLSAAAGTAATLVLHDNTSAAGEVLVSLTALAGDSVCWAPTHPYAFGVGCYANIGGAGANATVVYL